MIHRRPLDRDRFNGGFTLIEMLTVVVVLVLLAVIAVPSLPAIMKSQSRRDTLARLRRLPVEARERAIAESQVYLLVIDENGRVLLQRQPTDGSDPQTIGSVTIASGLQLTRFDLNGLEVGPDEWRIRFYSDGTADSGAFELDDAGEPMRFTVDPVSATSKLESGDLASLGTPKWEVGTYVRL